MISTVLSFLAKSIAALSDLVPSWLWVAIIAGALGHGCVVQHQRDGLRKDLKALQVDVATQEAIRAETARLAEAARRAAEARHQAEVAASKERTEREIADLELRVADLAERLRNRPERPSGAAVSGSAATPVACTGAQLYREDGKFLVGEAARADRLRIQLADCQRQYDAAVRLTTPEAAFEQRMKEFTKQLKGTP